MSEKGNISYQPTDGLSYDPLEAKYWNEASLQKELTRVFEVCHGCRMCFKYCDSFPKLFDFIDNRHDGDVRKVDASETREVMDSCFQCKLCEVQCPYTPRDKHEFQLDFPKLVHRYTAVRAKQEGQSLRDRVLGDPDATGKTARASFGMANVMNRVAVHRWFMEKVLGVHRDKLLPDFASQSFESWAHDEGLLGREPGGEAVLFQTCYVEHNEPEIGKDTIEVLKRNQVDVHCTSGLVCCGMPAWERGNLSELQERARTNLDVLEPYVDKGAKVLAINPTCSMMLRDEYPKLVAQQDRERAAKVAASVMDPSEYLWSIRKEERFNTQFGEVPEKVAYHAPCHLRAQGVGFKGRDLIRKAGAEISTVMECCGHDGTYAMTVEGFDASQRIGKKSFDGMHEAQSETWVTDCPLAAIQFEQHAGHKPLHPMSLLARSYRSEKRPKQATHSESVAAETATSKARGE
ncbi:MAG TPA: heterodisulfide reductase-related iron-sulfur binding cluster [Polyangiaceae bacterium]|nr:heterodisulfide reductase-related iron-sulfur binding cluster [Polyangiaceae bacterium]